jgi:hypothetical protein
MNKKHFRLALLIMLLLGCFADAYGQCFKYDKLYYEVLTDRTCAVVRMPDDSVNIFNCGGYNGDIVIPETVPYKGISYIVTEITGGIGRGTSLFIPKSIKKIPDNSIFGGKYESITVDKDNPYFDSRDNCNAVIETASNTLIAGCKKTIIPPTVTSIGDYAFDFCPIVSITIPNSVKQIGAKAFAQSSIVSITIPGSVKQIDKEAFHNCRDLKHISIEPGLSSIGENCFMGCDNLTSITLPSSISKIESGAFYYCSNLSRVTLLSYIPFDVLDSAFLLTVKEFHVLVKYKDNYQKDQNEYQFKIIADIKE